MTAVAKSEPSQGLISACHVLSFSNATCFIYLLSFSESGIQYLSFRRRSLLTRDPHLRIFQDRRGSHGPQLRCSPSRPWPKDRTTAGHPPRAVVCVFSPRLSPRSGQWCDSQRGSGMKRNWLSLSKAFHRDLQRPVYALVRVALLYSPLLMESFSLRLRISATTARLLMRDR